MKQFQTIKGKLIIFALCISLIPILVITVISYINARSMVKKQILQGLTAIAESKRMHILSFMQAKRGRVIDFSSDGFIRDNLETISHRGYQIHAVNNLNRYLKVNKKPLDHHIVAITIVDMNGKVVVSTNDTVIGKDMSKQELFTQAVSRSYGETCVVQPRYSPYMDAKCLCISAPLISRQGSKTMGVIVNAYDLAALSEITTNRVGMGETGEVYLVNRDKIMITESRFKDDASLKQVVDTVPVRKIAKEGKEMTGIYPDYRGVPIVGASAYVPEYGWTLLAEIDKSEAFAPLKTLGIVVLILGGVCAAAAVSIGIIFALSTARPINRLKYASERIASGNLKHRVVVNRKDEIGDLAGSFNDMAHKLENEIMEHKRTEEELSVSNKELEAFCYSVSHDLRAPLRSIGGFSEAIMEDYADGLNSKGKDYLKRVHNASQHMSQLIDDLLDLSRITRSDMRHETVDMSVIAQEIVENLRNLQPKRQLEFVIEKGLNVNGDKRLLRIALKNLLDNAWKFTGRHSCARIEFGVKQNNGDSVYFVSDDGAGFDMAYVDKLFIAFQRLHTSDDFDGTGIGLVTVQRIIHRHGGRVWAEGAVEKGATFYFTLT
ncbi:MAG: ATP-binding protein [Candidatus Scalinduaceae bacterium]